MTRTIFFIGGCEPEFACLDGWLRDKSAVRPFRDCADAAESAHLLPPDMILLAQSRPGQFPRESIETLHALWPLARMILLLGSWCEGETRTGKPIPGISRLFWYDAVTRLSSYFGEGEKARVWSMPRSVTDSDRLLEELDVPLPGSRGKVGIRAETQCAYDSLADGCLAVGFAPFRHLRGDDCECVDIAATIWDSRLGCGREISNIIAFSNRHMDGQVVVTASFPRLDAVSQLESVGIRVLAKPFQLLDLSRRLSGSIVKL